MKLKFNRFAFVATTLLAAPALCAATWNGATDASWATGTNWTGTQPDNITAQAIGYDATSAANLTQALNGSYTVTGITLGSPTGAVTVNAGTGTNTLTLGSGGIDMSTATQNLSLGSTTASSGFNITIGADQNWNVLTGRILTVGQNGGNLSLNNKVTFNGTGQVNLGGTGVTMLTGAGEIVVSSGILQNNLQTGSLSTGRSGATTLSGGTIAISTSISMFGTGAINLNSGAIGSGNTTGRDFGTANAVNFGGNFSFGIGTGLSTGAVRFGGATDLGGAVRTVTSGATGLLANNGAGAIFNGIVSNGGITKEGAGYVTLGSNSNTFAGATTINAGSLAFSQKALANSSSVTLANTGVNLVIGENGAGTHDINNLSGVSGSVIRSDFSISGTASARTLKVTQASDGTFAGSFTEGTSGRTIALLKTGTAKLTLSGTGGYTGGTTISQGTLAAITNGTALGSSGTVTINDANTGSNDTALRLGNVTVARAITVANQGSGTTTLGANGGAALPTFSGPITLAKDVILDGTGNTDRLTFSGGISGTGNVTISGGTNRVVFVTAANTYSGTTTVSANSILQLGTGGTDTGNHIPDASVVTVDSGGFLKLAKGANNETIGGLAGSGTLRGHEGVNNTASVLTIDGGASQNFSGVLENGGASGSTLSLTKTGTGTQTLSGVNTYTGATTVNGGTLALSGSGSIANSPTISVAAAGTLDVSAVTFTLGSTQTLSGAGTVLGSVGNGALGGTITASGGNLSIGSLAYSGDGFVNVTPGVAIVNVTNINGLSTSPDLVTINVQGGALTPGQYPLIDYAGSIQGSGVGSFVVGTNPGGAYSYTLVNNTTNSSVDLVVASLADVWSGAFSGEWSTASIGGSKNWTLNGSPTDYADAHDVQFTDAATGTTAVDVSVADVSPASVSFNNSSKNYTLQGSAAITGSTGLTKAGSGTLTISNVNKFAGDVLIGGGTVSVASLANGGVDCPLGAGFGISLANGTLSCSGTTVSTDRFLTISGPGTVDVAASNTTVTLTGPVSGSSSLSKTGAGVLVIAGASGSFSGTTQIDGGAFRFIDGGAWGGGAITDNATLEVNQSTALTLAGAISGTGALVKNGSGTLTLSGANSYAGGATMNAGTLQVENNTGLGSGTLTINGGSLTTGALERQLANNIHLGGSALLTGTAGTQGMRLNGVISGTGSLTKGGTGRVTLGNDSNSFTGTTSINTGLLATSTGALAASTSVSIANGAVLALGSNGTTVINNLSGVAGSQIASNFNITANGARTLHINQTVNGDFAGTFLEGGSRTISLIKSGSATLTLGGTATGYAGTTTVNAGTLAVTGTLGNTAVTVKNGATLAGSGNLGGSVTIEAGGTHSLAVAATPGAQVTRTIAGSLDLSAVGDILTLTAATTPASGTYVLATATGGITGVPESVTQSGVTGTFAVNGNNLELTVSSGGYAAWKTANGTTQTIDQDHDGDGVPNGVEFFFGGPNSTTGFTPQPGITGTTVTYTKHSGYTGVYGTDFVIETSETLTGAWSQETVGGDVVQSGDSFTYTFPTGGPAKKFVRLKVTGPQ